MKLTVEDLTSARYVPHLTKNDRDEGVMEPKGMLVLENGKGDDIGKALAAGDFQFDNPFIQGIAEVMALFQGESDISDDEEVSSEDEKEAPEGEKET